MCECDYCGVEFPLSRGCLATVSHGFGLSNTSMPAFCSPACRAWWRRRGPRDRDRTAAAPRGQWTLVDFVTPTIDTALPVDSEVIAGD